MNANLYSFISIDLAALLTVTFAALSCSLVGNFLLLRRLSLMGDAISHSVLPGIVVAFLLFQSRSSLFMFIGAAVAGILCTFLIEFIRKLGNLETGAAMGVVFSIFFALGVVLIEQAAARSIDLDPDCVLHGQLERIFWFPPTTIKEFFTAKTLFLLPRELITSATIFLLTLTFITLFFKELTLSAFDPALGKALGFNPTLTHFILMTLVAASVVASFEAVGSILVISMIICPPATARLLTDRLKTQLFLSSIFALISGIAGYLLGAFGPMLLNFEHSVSAAGVITLVSGGLLACAVLLSPRYGVIGRAISRFRLSVQILSEDILGLLYRIEEENSINTPPIAASTIGRLEHRKIKVWGALSRLSKLSYIERLGDTIKLTETGRVFARSLVRTHRLWESYLVRELGLRPDHVHDRAMGLEHITSVSIERHLEELGRQVERDPHMKPIPKDTSKPVR